MRRTNCSTPSLADELNLVFTEEARETSEKKIKDIEYKINHGRNGYSIGIKQDQTGLIRAKYKETKDTSMLLWSKMQKDVLQIWPYISILKGQ